LPTFSAVLNDLTAPDQATAAKLKQVGLDGKQLEMKLGKGRSLWTTFWEQGSRKWLGRLAGWINKVLESLAQAIPGGHAIKELKDACEEEQGAGRRVGARAAPRRAQDHSGNTAPYGDDLVRSHLDN